MWDFFGVPWGTPSSRNTRMILNIVDIVLICVNKLLIVGHDTMMMRVAINASDW